mmetsp:Transcript_9767/g.23198  ORF Transcript_9767/g.23198 Transcript_9767/m.23198 type:complete len:346 (-) Transcript_9767:111-1148(-)|eukprot:2039194-Rhodomonas_salina.1
MAIATTPHRAAAPKHPPTRAVVNVSSINAVAPEPAPDQKPASNLPAFDSFLGIPASIEEALHRIISLDNFRGIGRVFQCRAPRKALTCGDSVTCTSRALKVDVENVNSFPGHLGSGNICASRRPRFLDRSVQFTVPPLNKKLEHSVPLESAPVGGLWIGKFFDGFVWQEASWTLFFQDVNPVVKGKSGTCLSCVGTFLDGAAQMKCEGSYSPENGRVCWSQTRPGGKGSWEIWGTLYSIPMDSDGAGVAGAADAVDVTESEIRLLATWQDGDGKKGNMELCLVSGSPTGANVQFLVADSFWSALGAQPFVSSACGEDEREDWVVVPVGDEKADLGVQNSMDAVDV